MIVIPGTGSANARKGDFTSHDGRFCQATFLRRLIEREVFEGIIIDGTGSTNVRRGGVSSDDDHFSQVMSLRRLMESLGAFGLRVWAK